MKKRLLLAILMSITSLVGLMGQSTKKSLNYQAVILDPKAIDIPGAVISGQPLSKGKVCLKFKLLNALGNVDYEETQQTTTDEYGLVSLSIGTGSYSNGTYKNFESIIWDANVKSIEVAVSYDDCMTFKQVSTQTLNYTAYALYAEAVDYKNVRDAPTKLSQFINDPGFIIPKDLDPIKADIKTNTTDIKINTSQIAIANQTIADNKKNSDAAFLIVNQSLTSLDTKVAENTIAIKNNTSQIDTANQIIADNKKKSDAAFLMVNQSITSLDTKVAENTIAIKDNTSSIITINAKLNDQQNQIYHNSHQISATNAKLNDQQNQIYDNSHQISAANAKLNDQQNQINHNSHQISVTNNNLNNQIGGLQGQINNAASVLNGKADINSPTFTGTPVLPTGTVAVSQNAGDNSTKLATTAFVTSAVQNYLPRMTSYERNSINSPSEGLMLWNTTTKQLEVYDGSNWVYMNGNLVPPLNVGDSYGGGIVAYILTPTDPGYVAGQTHGLIAATSDQSTGIQWRNGSDIVTGAIGMAIGTGLANTNTIITNQGETQTDYAAGLARDHNGGQYEDWYLPSKDELNKLYLNRVAIGGFTNTYPYWSSTENDRVYAYYLFFNNGSLSFAPKMNTFRVRAVRSF